MAIDSADSDDLEALFDSIAGSVTPDPAPTPASPPTEATPSLMSGDIFSQLGQLTRKLHDMLRDVGHERVGQMHAVIEQASSKTKTAVNAIKPLQDSIENTAGQLSSKWQQLMDGKLSVDDFKVLAGETRTYLQEIPLKTKSISSQLMDIGPIQDTQSIKKLADIIQHLENQLVQILIENAPEPKKKELGSASTPDQVKSVLGSLGF